MKEGVNIEQNNWKRKTGAYLASQAISQLGSSLVDYSIIWYITLQTKSAMLMAIAMLCVFIPKIIISFYSGVWADKYNRKKLVIFADLFIAVVTLIFACLFWGGIKDLWLIFLTLGFRAIGTGIQVPASRTIIPIITPKSSLLRINGVNNSIESMISVLSPAIGGLILTYYSLEFIAFVDVVTAVIGVSILLKVSISTVQNQVLNENTSYVAKFKDSILYARNNKNIKRLLAMYLFLFFLAVPLSLLTPLKITRTFGDEVWMLSVNELLFSIGSILGGLTIALFGKKENGFKIICLSFIGIGIVSYFLSFPYYHIVIFSFSVIGFLIAFSNSLAVTIIQCNTEVSFQGRIFSLIQILSSVANLVGILIFGVLGDIVSIDFIFIAISIAFIIYSLFIYAKIKRV